MIAKGWPVTPLCTGNRILFYVIILTGAVVYWHWEAMIISYLAARSLVLPFQSMDDFEANTNLKVMFLSFFHSVFHRKIQLAQKSCLKPGLK